jgi:hypothetical protein
MRFGPNRLLYEATLKTQTDFETAINLHVNPILRRAKGKQVILPYDVAELLPLFLKVSEFRDAESRPTLRVEIFGPDGRGYSHQDFELA